jgi:fucose permease
MTWQVYLLMAYYAYMLNVFGPLTPYLRDELSISYTVASFHFSAFAVGILVIGFTADRIIQRVGRGQASWIGAIGMGAATLALIFGRTPALTIGGSFLMGTLGSLLVTTLPAIMADQYGPMQAIALTEMNMGASLSAAFASLAVGFFARFWLGWRMALVLPLVGLGLILLLFRPFSKMGAARNSGSAGETISGRGPADAGAKGKASGSLSAGFWMYWLLILAFVAVEFCMVFWGADFLEKSVGMFRADAASSLSLFLGGMVAGRLVSSRIMRRIPSERLTPAVLLVCGVGFGLFWLGGSPFLALLGLFITGMGVGPLYPLTLALAIQAAGAAAHLATARASLASGLAILLLPLLLGRLADLLGIRLAYLLIPVLLVVGLLLFLVSRNFLARERSAAQPFLQEE